LAVYISSHTFDEDIKGNVTTVADTQKLVSFENI